VTRKQPLVPVRERKERSPSKDAWRKLALFHLSRDEEKACGLVHYAKCMSMKSQLDWQLQIKKNLFFLCVKVILASFLVSCSSVCTVCFNLILNFYFLKQYNNIRISTLFCCTDHFTFPHITVTNLFNKTPTITRGLKKYRLETLPALLDHITLRGADIIANCKLVEKLFRVHTPWELINDLLWPCRQMISLCDNHFSSCLFPRFEGDKYVFHNVAIFRSGTLHEVTDV
jgi:hypothetical protein